MFVTISYKTVVSALHCVWAASKLRILENLVIEKHLQIKDPGTTELKLNFQGKQI